MLHSIVKNECHLVQRPQASMMASFRTWNLEEIADQDQRALSHDGHSIHDGSVRATSGWYVVIDTAVTMAVCDEWIVCG